VFFFVFFLLVSEGDFQIGFPPGKNLKFLNFSDCDLLDLLILKLTNWLWVLAIPNCSFKSTRSRMTSFVQNKSSFSSWPKVSRFPGFFNLGSQVGNFRIFLILTYRTYSERFCGFT
jgi:hypothetical protein